MCGIAGQVRLNGLDPDESHSKKVKAALARLAPRGPDGEGVWQDTHCLLAHRRLAIVDLSDAGAQPMVKGALAVVFNGMIYNYRALREELRAAGHSFDSDSDTEVLIEGWRSWGPGVLDRLVGMFSFGLWEAESRTLWLARDRFGQKPLLYRHRTGELAFASDLRALQRLSEDAGQVDRISLSLYCALRFIPEPRSILDGVAKLPAGHLARFDAAGLTVKRWYEPAKNMPFEDEPTAAQALGATVRESVADRLVADVPVGAFLSGGVDSAVVAACMKEATSDVRTFTIGFEGVPDYYEERPAARSVAGFLGTNHTEIAIDAAETLDVVDAVFDGLDEPFADSSAIPTYIVSRETRRHVTVALSGDGGDEVFAGYRKYQGELLAPRYRHIPAPIRRGMIEPLAMLLPESKSGRWRERSRQLKRFLAHGGKPPSQRQAGWMRLIEDDDLDILLDTPGPRGAVETMVAGLRQQTRETDPINHMLAVEQLLGLPGDMLVKVDRMSMAHGLEVRSPFLDHRVVECARRMPGRFKLRRGEGKHILRAAFRDTLPAEVFERPKKGFEVPIAEWLTGPLRDLTLDAISPERLARQELFRPELPAQWFRQLEGGRRDTSWQLWTMISFQAWWDRQSDAS